MKKPNNYLMFFKLLLVVLAFVMNSNYLYSQCVSCDGTETSGLFPSAIGRYTKATANYSFAGGIYSEANGSASFAFGNRAFAHGGSSAAIGQFVRINTSTAMVFGAGFDINNPLINDETHSLMIGFGSTKPTLFVGMSVGVNNTGRIGIGNVTSPQSKLHLLADENEIAELRLEHRTSGAAQYARVFLGTHTIRAGNNENMVFTTPNTSRHFVFTNGRVGIGTTSPQQQLHVADGDIYIEDISSGIIMKSPNGQCWRGVMTDNGTLTFSQTTCPGQAASVPDLPAEQGILKAYPNPGNDKLIIESERFGNTTEIMIFSLDGKMIHRQLILSERTEVSQKSFVPGTYILQLLSDGHPIENVKIVRQ